jgi:hypothetical protein
MAAAASKYRPTWPFAIRNDAGKSPGKSRAMTL